MMCYYLNVQFQDQRVNTLLMHGDASWKYEVRRSLYALDRMQLRSD